MNDTMEKYLDFHSQTQTMYRYQHSQRNSDEKTTPDLYTDDDLPEIACFANMNSRKAQKLFCVTSVLLIFTLVVYIPMMASRVHSTHGWTHKGCGTRSECDRKRELMKRELAHKKFMQQFEVRKFDIKENASVDDIHLFTKKLWHFKRGEAEKLFLYQKVLAAEWTVNKRNLKRMRYELRNHSHIDVGDLIVSKENSDVNATLDYYIFSKALPKNDSYYHFHMYDHLYGELPATSPFRNKLYKKCSVVGNSGIMLDSGCGEDIDQSDFVFRCNVAPLKPHRRDAGMKSNFTTMNPSILFKRFNELKTEKDIHHLMGNVSDFMGYIWLPCFSASHLNQVCLRAFNHFNITSPEMVLANPEHFVNIWKFWQARNHTKLISSGFYIAHVAMQLCQEVHLYGFWPFPVTVTDEGVKEHPYHYFNEEPFSKSHNMNDEFRLLLQMHEHGLLRMHMGQCAPPPAGGVDSENGKHASFLMSERGTDDAAGSR